MSQWYESAFTHEYLALYPHRDEDEALADVQRIVSLIAPPVDQPVLDLGCGAGRHLIALHEAGFSDLTGIDLSPDLLAAASTRLDRRGITGVRLIRSDMREIPFVDHFATALSMFSSFGYFAEEEQDAAVLRAVYRALHPTGVFLLDLMNRVRVCRTLVPTEQRVIDGRTVSIRRWVTSGERKRVVKAMHYETPEGHSRDLTESVRLYSPERIKAMIRQTGFESAHLYGSLDGEPFCDDSMRMVAVAAKGGL